MEPGRERAYVALDQIAEQPLHGARRPAMYHHRPLPRTVLRHVLEVETLRQLEVDLHSRVRELAPVGVLDLEVDLRSVESGFADAQLVGLAHGLERLDERTLGALPLLLGAQPLVLDVVARGQSV